MSQVEKSFLDLELPAFLCDTLLELGYEKPSPVQAEAIPALLSGRDVIAQAQTGTGKTAGFALPALARIDMSLKTPQVLVLAPTRELAIQVAEAFQVYARNMPGFHVLPIYGGQDFTPQLRALSRGVHVVVGTPGRVMDHLRRKSLSLEALKTLVLDEADEMLQMGFIDDVEWILTQIQGEHQTALLSATMPQSIKNIADKYLRNPVKIQIKSDTRTASTITQKYTLVAQHHKLEALTRFLEIEDFDATLIFARTKIATTELAEKLEARGYAVAALNGDMAQSLREAVIARLKKKTLDIVVATDVAARGLDVERIDFVINYDIPYDSEAYVHRIGRTGRAGRAGKSLLFVTPKERRALRFIENDTRGQIEQVAPPSFDQVQEQRLMAFKSSILKELASLEGADEWDVFIDQLAHETETSDRRIAGALAHLLQKHQISGAEDSRASLEVNLKAEDHERDSKRARGPREGGYSRGPRQGHRQEGHRQEGGRKEGGYASHRASDDRRGDRRDDRRGPSSESPRSFENKRSYEHPKPFENKKPYEGTRSFEGKKSFDSPRNFENKRASFSEGRDKPFDGNKPLSRRRGEESAVRKPAAVDTGKLVFPKSKGKRFNPFGD